jgi:hypothetical protein
LTIKIWRVLWQNKALTTSRDYTADDFGKLIDKMKEVRDDLTRVTQVLLLSEVEE